MEPEEKLFMLADRTKTNLFLILIIPIQETEEGALLTT